MTVSAGYRHLFEHHPDPLVVLGAEGQILDANRAAAVILGSEADDVAVSEWARLGLTAGGFAERRDAAADGRVVRWEFEHPMLKQAWDARLTWVPGYTLEGDGYLWIGRKATDHTQLEQVREEFVNMLVHDLRVPLGNVMNCLDLALTAWREHDATLPIEQILQIGLRSAHRMEDLINDILESARLRAQERTLSIKPVDVEAIIEEAVETVAAAAARRKQTLLMRVAPDLPSMDGDLDLLRRVLINLLANAVKFTQEGGKIVVSAKMDRDHFLFGVTDNGPGIAAEHQAHLFELFFRGDARGIRGAGIGLAYCKLAVEAHGGRIWVESILGEGASFNFTIPRDLTDHPLYVQEPQR